MKIKLLISVFCAFLMLCVFTGCGLEMQENSEITPSGDTSSSPTGEAIVGTTTVRGVVNIIDNGTLQLDLVEQIDAPILETAQTVVVGSIEFVVTGEPLSLTPEASTTVILENRGYATGSLADITEGDFLVVVLSNNSAITILDFGSVDTFNDEPSTTSPSPSPSSSTAPTDDPDAGESAGVPDSSVKTTYTVITDGLKARSGPATTDSVLGILDKGARVTGIVSDGWLEFTYDGKTAYCSAQFLEVSTAPEGVPDSSTSKTYKTADNVQVRSGPGTTYTSLGKLDKGTKVTGTVTNGWLEFTFNDKTAYCSASYLTVG